MEKLFSKQLQGVFHVNLLPHFHDVYGLACLGFVAPVSDAHDLGESTLLPREVEAEAPKEGQNDRNEMSMR